MANDNMTLAELAAMLAILRDGQNGVRNELAVVRFELADFRRSSAEMLGLFSGAMDTMATRIQLITAGATALATMAKSLGDATSTYVAKKDEIDAALPDIVAALAAAQTAVGAAQTAIDAANKAHDDADAAATEEVQTAGLATTATAAQSGSAAQPQSGSGTDASGTNAASASGSAGSNATGTAAGAPVSVSVTSASAVGSIALPVNADLTALVGGSVTGPGIADGTVVRPETQAQVLVISAGLTAAQNGGETLTVTPPAKAAS